MANNMQPIFRAEHLASPGQKSERKRIQANDALTWVRIAMIRQDWKEGKRNTVTILS